MKQITCIFMAAFLSLAVFAGERPARQIQIGKKNTAVATAVDTEIVVAPDAPQRSCSLSCRRFSAGRYR